MGNARSPFRLQTMPNVNLHQSRHTVGAQEVVELPQLFLTHYLVRPLPTGHRAEVRTLSLETPPEKLELKVEGVIQGCTGCWQQSEDKSPGPAPRAQLSPPGLNLRELQQVRLPQKAVLNWL